jgi:predicted dehydrogenase
LADQGEAYGLSVVPESAPVVAPDLAYLPRDPRQYRPGIGVIGCGNIAEYHLTAYQQAGYRVLALCDPVVARATERQARFFPEAAVYADYQELLRRGDIEVVDVTPHPAQRAPILADALEAGKHVLSQKPFVLDLEVGQRLVDLADRRGVKLAVNQNGRWAPHFSYLRQVVRPGLIGDLTSVSMSVHWDHTWVAGTPFDQIHDLVLYDFAIHWFDIISCFFGSRRALRVFASTAYALDQAARPPLLAQALIEYEHGQAAVVFDGRVIHGQEDRTYLAGTKGSAVSSGPSLSEQTVTLFTAEGHCSPSLRGTWFPDGFHGAMGELLCAIEEGREPLNSARDNLRSLELTFAAIASAREGVAKIPGEVRCLPSL